MKKQPTDCSIKPVLKNFAKFTSFFKINFIKKETPTQASEKFLRALFPQNTSGWLLLTVAAPQEQDNNL